MTQLRLLSAIATAAKPGWLALRLLPALNSNSKRFVSRSSFKTQRVAVVDSVNSAPIVKETPSRVVGRQGSRVELPCVSSAFPLPTYTWSRAGVLVNVTSRVTQVAGNLVLNPARLDDTGVYVCRTWNQLGSRDVSVTLVVTGLCCFSCCKDEPSERNPIRAI